MIWLSDAQWNYIVAMLQRIDVHVRRMETQMSAMDDAIAALGTQVQANTDAEASAAGVIQQLADLIKTNAGNPTAVTELATKLKTSADALAAAIVANTPSA